MLRKISLIVLFFSILLSAHAQYDEFSSNVFVNEQKDSLLYRQLNPEKMEPGKKYPLVLFLHGAGERGSDNVSQLRHGGMMFTNPVNMEKYPCLAVFPQCPSDLYWPTPKRPNGFNDGDPFPADAEISKPLRLTKELLDRLFKEYPIDTSRIYIVGLSMGGMGTFDMVCRFPDLFAAAVPICGGVSVTRLEKLSTKTAFRIFHGDADSVVPIRFSREAYKKLKEVGINVEYIEFPGVNHGSWEPAFNQPDFMSWLFQQSK